MSKMTIKEMTDTVHNNSKELKKDDKKCKVLTKKRTKELIEYLKMFSDELVVVEDERFEAPNGNTYRVGKIQLTDDYLDNLRGNKFYLYAIYGYKENDKVVALGLSSMI